MLSLLSSPAHSVSSSQALSLSPPSLFLSFLIPLSLDLSLSSLRFSIFSYTRSFLLSLSLSLSLDCLSFSVFPLASSVSTLLFILSIHRLPLHLFYPLFLSQAILLFEPLYLPLSICLLHLSIPASLALFTIPALFFTLSGSDSKAMNVKKRSLAQHSIA